MKKLLKLKTTYRLLLIAFCLFLLPKISHAATYYVCDSGATCGVGWSTGDDSNSGTAKLTPFKTAYKSTNVGNPGDTFIFGNGVYTDTDGNKRVLNITRSGSATGWITFKSENKWGAKLQAEPANATPGFFPYIVIINANVAYVSIENFEMTGGNRAYHNPNNGNNHHITVKGNNIHDICQEPFNCNGVCCEGDVPDVNGTGLYVGGDTDVGGGMPTNNMRIENNIISNLGPLKCTYPPYTSSRWDHGIYISHDAPSEYTYILNNVFINTNRSGYAIAHATYTGADANHVYVINNTFYDSEDWGRSGTILYGVGTSNNVFQNNLIYSKTNACFFLWGISCGTGNSLKNNYCLNIDTGKLWSNYSTDCTASINFSGNYCNDSSQCGANIASDPKFVSIPSLNFHLQSTSPAINKGLSYSGRTVDADGKSIVGAPDIGAYEYGGGTSDTTPPAAPQGLTVN
jgi:hypothetical protein